MNLYNVQIYKNVTFILTFLKKVRDRLQAKSNVIFFQIMIFFLQKD